ncbi:MAG: sigma-70 family RNA polymerase sigma factor [Elusimicrobiaceae bacterium]|nr:sigma-70 family RNA polymerase sigma factor [Elusimicrobiaceae bacterium]
MNFEETYKTYFKRIFAYVCSRTGNETTAEDISLNIWQKILEKFSSYDESKGNIEQWLFTIARNEVNSYFRLYFIKNFFSLTGKEELHQHLEIQPLENLASEEDKKLLFQCLQDLDKRERDLISLKFFSSLNNREIAKVSGLSESNVGTILKRSLDKIRLKMESL